MNVTGKLYWVVDSVVVNTAFNALNNKYELKLGNISTEDQAALLEKFGVVCKDGKDDQGKLITPKSKYKFEFKDVEGNELDPYTIGNGSEATIYITGSYDHAFAKRYGKGPAAGSKVVVTSLVEKM